MRKTMVDFLARCRTLDWTVLYLRLFLGGMMLLHNIGKMQMYNEIVNTYPALFHMSSAATFTVVGIVEALLAVSLIIGFRVRTCAAVMAAGMLVWIILTYPGSGFTATELQFVYMGTYVALIISGGGIFSLDSAIRVSSTEKGNK